MSNQRGKEIKAEWDAENIDNWKSSWQDVAIYEHPLESWINTSKEEGQELRDRQINPIGEEALTVFTDGFVGSTMPKTDQWAEFEPVSTVSQTTGREVPPTDRVKKAYRIASDRFIKLLAESNFYEAIHESTRDGGAFGTACPGVFKGKRARLNFMNVAPGEFQFDEDEEGFPVTVRRRFKMTAAQIKSKFDAAKAARTGDYIDELPDKIQKIIDSKDPKKLQQKHWVIERVSENPNGRNNARKWSGRPFIGEYILHDTAEHFFSEGYFHSLPWAPWRLDKSSQEKYGRGLGMKALPTIRKIQKMEKEYLYAIEIANDPEWLQHADAQIVRDRRPGGTTKADWTREDEKPQRLDPPQAFRDLEVRIEKEENKVRSMHFNEIFRLFLRDDIANKELKAAQVDAMMDEKLPLLVGVANRFLNECLTPLLTRAFYILYRGGAFDDLKQDLGQVDQFRITFRSRIAMAVKALENRGIQQIFNLAAMAAQIPGGETAHLKIDMAGMLGRYAENSTAPSEYVRTDSEYAEELRKIQEAQAVQNAAATAETLGKANKGFQE